MLRNVLAGIGRPRVLFRLAAALTACSLLLLFFQFRTFERMRTEAVRLAEELPAMQSRVRFLEARLDAQRSFGNDVRASLEEQAAMYVFPSAFDAARTVRVMQEVLAALRTGASALPVFTDLSLHPSHEGGYDGVLHARGTPEDMARMVAVLGMGRYLTVHDSIGSDAEEFLLLLESSYPLALPSAERFLALDLLSYAVEPDVHEQRMLQDVPSSVAPDLRAFLLDAGLRDVRLRLSPVAAHLHARRAWPFPLASVRFAEYVGDTFRIGLFFPVRESGQE